MIKDVKIGDCIEIFSYKNIDEPYQSKKGKVITLEGTDYLRALFDGEEDSRLVRQVRVASVWREGSRLYPPADKYFIQAKKYPGHWELDIDGENNIWEIPDGDLPFEMNYHPGPWRLVRSIRGLAVDLHGRIYGLRTLSNPVNEGYICRGRLSIGGKKYTAFTSSHLFQKENRLVNVGTLVI